MSFDLDQYIVDATRTESPNIVVKVDPVLLASVLTMFVSSGNILDQIKKHCFYGKDYNFDNIIEDFKHVLESLDKLKGVVTAPNISVAAEEELDVNSRVFHSIIGIATEASELVEALSNTIATGEMDNVNILEEFGDLNWYQAIGIDALGGQFDRVLTTNIEKLRARYPDKFTNELAINRKLDEEREILQRGSKN